MWIATNKLLNETVAGVFNPEAYQTPDALNAGWELIEVKSTEAFIKDDSAKLRYGLIPLAHTRNRAPTYS